MRVLANQHAQLHPRNLPHEKWAPIKGFEHRYEASNKGRVRQFCDDNGRPCYKYFQGRAYQNVNSGYNLASARLRSKDLSEVTTMRLAEIVLRTWVSDPPDPVRFSQRIHFKDGDRNNLDPNNLAWYDDVREEAVAEKRRAKEAKQRFVEEIIENAMRSRPSTEEFFKNLEARKSPAPEPLPIKDETNATPVTFEDPPGAELTQSTLNLDATWEDIIAEPPFLRPEWFQECVAAGVLAPDKYRAMRESAGLARNVKFESNLRKMLT
jgi:hypothetical protein